MIAQRLKLEIEEFARRQRRDNPLLALARSGAVSPDCVAAYLGNVLYLIRHTPLHLELARARALELGQAALAEHYAKKAGEEAGHDRWAEGDIARVRELFGVTARLEPSAPMRRLVVALEAALRGDPAVYLAYVLFAEYFTLLLGPEWLAALERECGVPKSALSVVAEHVELDRDHVADGLAEIDALLGAEREVEPFLRVLCTAMVCFEDFCAGLCAAPGARRARPHELASSAV